MLCLVVPGSIWESNGPNGNYLKIRFPWGLSLLGNPEAHGAPPLACSHRSSIYRGCPDHYLLKALTRLPFPLPSFTPRFRLFFQSVFFLTCAKSAFAFHGLTIMYNLHTAILLFTCQITAFHLRGRTLKTTWNLKSFTYCIQSCQMKADFSVYQLKQHYRVVVNVNRVFSACQFWNCVIPGKIFQFRTFA